MILAYYLVTIHCIQSASVIQELGTVYLSPNEVFQDSLYNYFDGEFLKFSLDPENSSFAHIEGGYNLSSIDFYQLEPMQDPQATVLSTSIVKDTGLIISANGLNLTIFSLDLATGIVQKNVTKEIKSTLINARITDAAIINYSVVLVVTGDELINGFQIKANELFFVLTNPFLLAFKLFSWDLKYVNNLRLHMETTAKIIFWGNLYDRDSVFYCALDYTNLVTIQQISQYFKPNSSEPLPVIINDLIMLQNAVIVLQKAQGIVVYLKYDDLYFQKEFISIKDFGELYQFSTLSSQLNSLFIFGVTTSTGLVFLEYRTFIIKLFIPKIISPNTVCQVFTPYIFIFTSSYIEIYHFQYYNVSSMLKVPFQEDNGKVEIVENFIGFSVIKQNSTGVEFFLLNVELFVISVVGTGNNSITVVAEDEYLSVKSRIDIRIIEDLYSGYMINNYRASSYLKQNIFFDSLNFTAELNIFDVVSGWDLSVDLKENREDFFTYNFSTTYPYSIILNNTLTNKYISGCYSAKLYLINNTGVYIEENLLINKSGPIGILAGLNLIQVLYPGMLLLYSTTLKTIKHTFLQSNCSNVFKFLSGYTLCADSENLLIFDHYNYFRLNSFAYLNLTHNELITDIAVFEKPSVGSCFLYILTKSRILYYLYENSNLTLSQEYNETGSFIIAIEPYLFVIDSELRVFSNDLSVLFRTIPLPATPVSISNIFYVLYMQIGDVVYMFNGNCPIIESLSAVIPAKDCQLFPSISSVLLLCPSSAQVYTDRCNVYCQNRYSINFFIEDPLNITRGKTEITTNSSITWKNSSLDLYSYYNLYTYSLVLNFDYDYLENSTYFLDYNKEQIFSLDNYFEGFNLEYQLYVNESVVTDPSFPMRLKPQVVGFTYYNSTKYTFIDHDTIPYTEIVLILCSDAILILDNSLSLSENVPYNLQLLTTIPQSEYFNQNGSCNSINYVSTKGPNSLFVLNCYQITEYGFFYMDQNITNTTLSQFIVLFELNTQQLLVRRTYSYGINHFVSWTKVVTSSNSCFVILAIDIIYEKTLLSVNNNLMVYSVCWKTEVVLSHLVTINFCKLNLPRMQIVSVDGSYQSTPDCSTSGTLYLYISDLFYGLRVVKVTKKTSILQSSIFYSNDLVLSVTLCGNLVFSLSELGFIDVFFIDKFHDLDFYQTMQPASNHWLEGTSSYFSCSSFYKPHYLALYLISKSREFYQLRLIDIKSQTFTTYFKFIDLPVTGKFLEYKGKSVFLNDSVITVLGVNNGEFYTYLLSEIQFVIETMNASEYKSLVRRYGTDVFEVFIEYSNMYLKKNSTRFRIGRIGPEDKEDDKDSSYDAWWILVVALVVLVLVTLVSFVIYKRVIGKKTNKIEQDEQNSIQLLQVSKRVRLSMVHHEDTLK